MVTGLVPHVGGPILPPCKVNVLTGKLPQARVTDMALCVGPTDVIVKGSSTVLVGGLPAARIGDNTAHGGVIVAGCPTVLIGDAGGGGGGGGGGAGAGMSAAASFQDPAAQAAALINAARSGTPFCERCAAAAAAPKGWSSVTGNEANALASATLGALRNGFVSAVEKLRSLHSRTPGEQRRGLDSKNMTASGKPADPATQPALEVARQVAPAPPSGSTTRNSKLGSLSERYEVGDRGPGTVSSGRGDPGGVSYGSYQIATKTGTMGKFLAVEGQRWSSDFSGKTPGSPEFSQSWQSVAAREPTTFHDAQHAFIERTHYKPAVEAVRAQTGLDLDQRSAAVRNAAWSTAVQHGRASKLLAQAVSNADGAANRADAAYDAKLIEEIYAERTRYLRDLAAGATNEGERATFLGIANNRYPAESKDALAMLAAERSR
ncbi:MAG TPA: PAAR domain-containing protein [Allosphingosinicella sp.]|nr:PAAR domain-containing protein [Allosphingosinicella sp.]